MKRSVWTYDDLFAVVKRPPIPLEVNPALFSEYNFVIALSNLITPSNNIISAKQPTLTDNVLLDKLFDYNDRFIYHNNSKYKIEQVGIYYVMVPIIAINNGAGIDTSYAEYSEISRDKELALLRETAEPNERPIIDADSFIRQPKPTAGLVVDVNAYVRDSREDINYTISKKEFLTNYPKSLEYFLFSNTTLFQQHMVKDAIASKYRKDMDPVIADSIISLIAKFGAIINAKEIRKYKDVASQFKTFPEDDSWPLGITMPKVASIYNIADDNWIDVSKIAINRQVTYRENEIVIGVLDNTVSGVKFRMRRPQHVIKEVVQEASRNKKPSESSHSKRIMVGDIRFIERGIVCTTKSKNELLQLISKLGVSQTGMTENDLKIKNLCVVIRDQLYQSEMKERQKDSKYKYMYFWWDEQPHSSSYI